MSKKFTKSLEEKYGLRGKKGRKGELFFKDFYERKGYIVHDKNDSIFLQTAGIDFIIESHGNKYTVDVKCNLKVEEEDLFVVVEIQSNGWLFNKRKTSQYISHVNVDYQILVTYNRKKMQSYIMERYADSNLEIVYVPVTALSFAKVEYLGTVL